MYDLFNPPPTFHFFRRSISDLQKDIKQTKEELLYLFDWWHSMNDRRHKSFVYSAEKEQRMRGLVDYQRILEWQLELQTTVENLSIKEKEALRDLTIEQLRAMVQKEITKTDDVAQYEEIKRAGIYDLRAHVYYKIKLFEIEHGEDRPVFRDTTLEECRKGAVHMFTHHYSCVLPIKKEL